MSTILIGVDGSQRSADAVTFGRRLASSSGARVLVACVFPSEDADGAPGVYGEQLHAGAEQTVTRLRAGLAELPDERIATRTIGRSSPARALHALAESERPELVVVGSTHTGHLRRVLPGSTGERLLHGSPCAVAVVPRRYRARADEPFRRIGVGVDGSAESQAALVAAAELARALGARLKVIDVLPADRYGSPAATGGPGYYLPREEFERRQKQRLDEALASLPADLDVAAVPLAGNPARELIEYSERLDLLIVGSRGYGPLRALLADGVSGRVVRGARCPVIARPPRRMSEARPQPRGSVATWFKVRLWLR